MQIIRNFLKLTAKYAFAALIMIQIRYFTVILVILVFILLAMGYKKYPRTKLIIVIVANIRRDIIIKKLCANFVIRQIFLLSR